MNDVLTSERATERHVRQALWRWLLVPSLVLAFAWSYGLYRLITTKGILVQQIRDFEAHPVDEHNLASFKYGPTISASSYENDFGQQHHPVFLIDGMTLPSRFEKWGSHPRDRHPWVQILWHEPMTLNRVVVMHSGAFKEDASPLRNYTIRCIQSKTAAPVTTSSTAPFVKVSNNTESTATHELRCRRAYGIRLEAEPNDSKSVVQLYELEAWGQ